MAWQAEQLAGRVASSRSARQERVEANQWAQGRFQPVSGQVAGTGGTGGVRFRP